MKKSLLFLLLACAGSVHAQTIAAGGAHSVYICPNGSAVSVGRNQAGQLGWGQLIPQTNETVDVQNLTGIAAVSANDEHTLFLMDDGTVYACGRNWDGRLGLGSYSGTNVPLQISTLSDVVAVSAGRFHSLFLKSDGTVWAAGDNQYGALGDGSNTTRNVPVQVNNLTGVTAIAAGAYFSLFLMPNGDVYGCGYNDDGQLGTQNYNNSNEPVAMVVSSVSKIAAGYAHSLMLKTDGTVWSCGRNDLGQLALGGNGGSVTPTVLQTGLGQVSAIAGGYAHSLFLRTDGTVWAAGDDTYGQLGDDANFVGNGFPQQVSGLTEIAEIAAGDNHSVFKKSDGTYFGCGSNELGQLANGTNGGGNFEPEPIESTINCAVTAVDEPIGTSSTELICYPNPATDLVAVVTDSEANFSIEVFDAMGRIVFASTMKQRMEISLEQLPSGAYMVQITDLETGKRTSNRILKL
ncbi:MAG: T9SS type A sorting domain-containing protein [Flavobacteriales bacterium]|nr:T9SS type A sorting domain-containing protein [Flavobacteriales bacterium]